MKGRWSLAVKECMGNDVKGFLTALEESADWTESAAGRPVNPAQYGGGRVKGKLVDTSNLDLDRDAKRTDENQWLMTLALRNRHLSQKNRAHLRLEMQRSFLPEARLPFVYRSQHAALDTARRLNERLTSGVSEYPLEEKMLVTGSSADDSVPPVHPLVNGPAVVAEDSMGAQKELERRRDALMRMKFEIFNNRIQARFVANHFDPMPNPVQPTKSIFRFYYDGDDLTYVHDRPIAFQIQDKKRGSETLVGSDLDTVRLKHFQRFVKRVAQLGAPESVGDLHRLLSEQRALEGDLRNESYALSEKMTTMVNRRDAFFRSRGLPMNVALRQTIAQEQPLVARVVGKKRAKKTLDEAYSEAKGDVLQARNTLAHQRANASRNAFSDDREDSLMEAGDPTKYLPEMKRATTWLDKFTMPGSLEDPRLYNPFTLARDASAPLSSELRGRPVAPWEADDYSGLPHEHRAITEKVSSLFDYKRASDRVMNGLEEKAFCDWRPSMTPDQKVFEQSVQSRGYLNRRPIRFYSKDTPDLRMTKEWDDVIGAPLKPDTNVIDKVAFYRQRIAWEKRKELAIKWGLEPKPNETLHERDERRLRLDARLMDVVVERTGLNEMVAWPSSLGRIMSWHGKRHFRGTVGDKSDLYPLDLRPVDALLKTTAIDAGSVTSARDTEAIADHDFHKTWLNETTRATWARRQDPRVDYLDTAGLHRISHKKPTSPANSYAQAQDALWELRVYRNEPEPSPNDRTWLEEVSSINSTDTEWWMKLHHDTNREFQETLKPEYRSKEVEVAQAPSEDDLGWKSPSEIDKWKATDGRDGLVVHREMTYPVDDVNNIAKSRWLAKTPWDRIAASELTTKVMDPEQDARPQELGSSYYFNRNRTHYYRLPVQRLRAYSAELREAKEVAERMIPQDMSKKIKNFYAVARHSTVPFFSNHVTKNGPKFVNTPKVAFDNIGLHDDLEDYIRINPHLAKWDEM